MPGRGHLGRVACPLNRDDRRATAALGDGCPTRSTLTARSVEDQLVGRSPEYRRGNPTENPVGKTEVVLQLAGPAGGRQKHSVVVSKTRGSSTVSAVAPDLGLRPRAERAGCGSSPEPAGHNSGMALSVGEGPERRKPNELGRRIRSLTHAYQSLVSLSPSRVMPPHSHSPTGQGNVARRSCPKPAGHNSGMDSPHWRRTRTTKAERTRPQDPTAHA